MIYLISLDIYNINSKMHILPSQIIAARSLLGWSQTDLALKSALGVATIRRFEKKESINAANIKLIILTLEKFGIQFINTETSYGVLINTL